MHAPGGVRFIRNENRMEWKARTITSAFKKETFDFDNRVIPDFGEKLRVSLAISRLRWPRDARVWTDGEKGVGLETGDHSFVCCVGR